MTLSDLVLIAATVAGPIAAVQVQKWLERSKAGGERREAIFKALMSTRGFVASLSPRHVEALNMIELEFRGDKFREVRDRWKTYLAHLNAPMTPDQSAQQRWAEKRTDLLTELLKAMGATLGYDDVATVDISNGWYAPMQHFHEAEEQRQLRQLLIKALQSGALAVEAQAPASAQRPVVPGHLEAPRLKGP